MTKPNYTAQLSSYIVLDIDNVSKG